MSFHEERTKQDEPLRRKRKRSQQKHEVLDFMHGKTELDHLNSMQIRFLKKHHPAVLKGLLLRTESHRKHVIAQHLKHSVKKEKISKEEVTATSGDDADLRRSNRLKDHDGDIIKFAGAPEE
ncbi:MAG: hypothetical protein Q9183_007020, partial [Haloplaca sp. 2 TL-2023]